MARARFIVMQPDSQLVAVFGDDASRTQLDQIVARLMQTRGAYAQVVRVALSSPIASSSLTISLRVEHSLSAESVVRGFKRLTNPEIPYTLHRLNVLLLLCKCRYVSAKYSGQFVRGLAPDDQEAFWLRFYARIQKVTVDEMLPHGPKPPYQDVGDLVERIMRESGAYPSETSIEVARDNRPCRHPQ